MFISFSFCICFPVFNNSPDFGSGFSKKKKINKKIMSFDDTLWLWMIIFMNILLACFEMKNFASNNNQSMAGKLDMYWDPCK